MDANISTAIYKSLKEKSKYSSKTISIIIHTTLLCNLRCDYCYQKPVNSQIQMDDKTIADVILFINNIVKKENPLVLDIVFIGGEPLLNWTAINDVTNSLSVHNDVEVTKTLITNGTLLNNETVILLKKYNFTSIQVTLDGFAKYHDQFRKFHNGEGSYNIIIENIKKFQHELPFIININLNERNAFQIEKLMQELNTLGIKSPITFSLVFDTNSCRFKHTISKYIHIWRDVHLQAINFGYTFKPFYRDTYLTCGLYKDHEYIISPDGFLYKCISGVGNPKFALSSLQDFGSFNYYEKASQFVELDLQTTNCKKCKYKVFCGIDCLYRNEVEYICDKNVFEDDIDIIRRSNDV